MSHKANWVFKAIEELFTVRFYYSLQRVGAEGTSGIKQRYADIEWLGLFQPQSSGGEEGKHEQFELCDKGFVIHNVEVNEF